MLRSANQNQDSELKDMKLRLRTFVEALTTLTSKMGVAAAAAANKKDEDVAEVETEEVIQ